jgi:hypothetical protein
VRHRGLQTVLELLGLSDARRKRRITDASLAAGRVPGRGHFGGTELALEEQEAGGDGLEGAAERDDQGRVLQSWRASMAASNVDCPSSRGWARTFQMDGGEGGSVTHGSAASAGIRRLMWEHWAQLPSSSTSPRFFPGVSTGAPGRGYRSLQSIEGSWSGDGSKAGSRIPHGRIRVPSTMRAKRRPVLVGL